MLDRAWLGPLGWGRSGDGALRLTSSGCRPLWRRGSGGGALHWGRRGGRALWRDGGGGCVLWRGGSRRGTLGRGTCRHGSLHRLLWLAIAIVLRWAISSSVHTGSSMRGTVWLGHAIGPRWLVVRCLGLSCSRWGQMARCNRVCLAMGRMGWLSRAIGPGASWGCSIPIVLAVAALVSHRGLHGRGLVGARRP